MTVSDLRYAWREIVLKDSKPQVRLRDILIKCCGEEVERGGRIGLVFDNVQEELNPFVLRPEEVSLEDPTTYLYYWDEERETWEYWGEISFTAEWGNYQLQRFWNSCGIVLAEDNRQTQLKDIFSYCLSEKYGGVLFIGKGKFDGEAFILKLDEEERLQNYFEPQKCFYLDDKETDEWKIFGTLIKNPS